MIELNFDMVNLLKVKSVVSVFFKLEIGIINNIDWFVWLVYEVDKWVFIDYLYIELFVFYNFDLNCFNLYWVICDFFFGVGGYMIIFWFIKLLG